MRIVNLASGSKGNSTFVGFGETKILIDAGISEKQLCERLVEIGEKLSDIQGVCITHEHIDHIRAVKALVKKYDMVFYVHKKLAESSAFQDIKFKEVVSAPQLAKLEQMGKDKDTIFAIEVYTKPEAKLKKYKGLIYHKKILYL